MSLYKRGKVWWSRIVRGGKVAVRSTKKTSRNDAVKVESIWIAEIENSGGVLPEKKRAVYLQAFFEDQFYPYLENNVAAERTRTFYKESAKPLLFGTRATDENPNSTTGLGSMLLTSITSSVIEAWVQQRSREVGPASVNSSLKTLRRALRLAVEWGILTKAPKIKLVKGERQREFVITEELLGRMLAHEKCTAFLKDLLPFLIDTGLRISEALALTWSHVGLEPKPGASKGWVYVEKGKSKFARRYVPLTERAHNILTERNKSLFQWVWPSEDGEQLSRHWPSEQFRILRDAMELPDDCVVHSCRHTFCTRLGEAGVDPFTIQKLAGHSSIVISSRYVHPTSSVIETAINKMQQVTSKEKKKKGAKASAAASAEN